MRPSMLEKEIFPKMAEDGVLYALDLESFWMDVGQPRVYNFCDLYLSIF